MRKLLTIAPFAILASCSPHLDRSASVDTTLPNGTTLLASGDALADNMDMLADNMEAQAANMDSMTDNMSAVDSAANGGIFTDPSYAPPARDRAPPTDDADPADYPSNGTS